jgi:hypothetical protein
MEFLTRESNKQRGWRCGVVSVLMMTLLVLLALTPAARSAPTVASEYQLKAVFLFNFTQFVEWPPEAFAEPGAPLVIGILGEDPFGAYLDETVRGEMVNGRPLIVQRYRRVDDIKSCHVLFVSRSEAEHLTQVLSSLKGRSILTVSDLDGFTRDGGVIRFATVANKIRLRISLDAAQSAKLTISSKLLRPAEIVGRGEQ